MNCPDCATIQGKKHTIYQDQLVSALLNDKPWTAGHIIVVPNEHQAIIEKLSDEIMGHLFLVANRMSAISFEVMKAQGTNIIIRNGVAAGQNTNHTRIDVIPRIENDGINLQWNTLKLSDDDIGTVYLQLQEELKKDRGEQKEEKADKKEEPKPEPKVEIPESENYLLKQLNRMP